MSSLSANTLKHLKNLRKPIAQQELRPGESEIQVNISEEEETKALHVSDSTMKVIEELKRDPKM
jgi:hypothetical protein